MSLPRKSGRVFDECYAVISCCTSYSAGLTYPNVQRRRFRLYRDFTYDASARTSVCPPGKLLYRKGARNITNGLVGEHVRGAKRDCVPCALRTRCLRTTNTNQVRNVAFFAGRADLIARNYTAEMKAHLDIPDGRRQYGERFAAVEPVFGNLRANKRLDRFTLRGRAKVDAQWKLYCLVHNIEKLVNAGYAA